MDTNIITREDAQILRAAENIAANLAEAFREAQYQAYNSITDAISLALAASEYEQVERTMQRARIVAEIRADQSALKGATGNDPESVTDPRD